MSDRVYQTTTLERRRNHLAGRLHKPDSAHAKRFNRLEMEALDTAILCMQREEGLLAVVLDLVDSIASGDREEMLKAAEFAEDRLSVYEIDT